MTGDFFRNRDLCHSNPNNLSCPCSAARVELSQSGGGKKGKAKALYDFHGENEDELSFKVSNSAQFSKRSYAPGERKKIGIIWCENRRETRKNKAHRTGIDINKFDKCPLSKIFCL